MGLNSLDRTAKELDGILITHEHIDHVQGLGVLARRYQIPIYATEGTIHAILECRNLGKFPEGIFHEIREDEPLRWEIWISIRLRSLMMLRSR